MTTELYVPSNGITLDKVSEQQIRIGLQGYPGTGKTHASLTFPNPIVVNLDRGLGSHTGRADVVEMPFWDKQFCLKVNANFKGAENLKDLILKWLSTEATKIPSGHTLVFDGGTGLQNAFQAWVKANNFLSDKGKEDAFAQWRFKLDYFGEIMELFKTLKCHVVYCCHETEKKDKGGEYTGKLRPLLTGQFVDQLTSHFTDWFRCMASNKLPDDKITDKVLKDWGMANKQELLDVYDTFPRGTIYYWQTEPDDISDCKSSTLVKYPRFIPAGYQYFKKYMKQSAVVSA